MGACTPTYTPTFTPTSTSTNTATFTSTATFTATPTPVPTTVTIDYIYDPLNRLTEANYSTGDYYHYGYDEVGNRKTQESRVGGLIANDTYNYDSANRLTDVNGVTYTWDANGNLLNDGANTYTYDAANRLSSVTNGQLPSSYAYNGRGDRLQQTVGGLSTNYTLDLNMGLTQVLSDGTNTYYYGADRIAQKHGADMDYFLGDALDSVRQLTDANGLVISGKSYEPYGEVRATWGSGATVYGFTGEQTDVTGMVYLRARYYTPQEGRFIVKDARGDGMKLPASINLYKYAYDNPINYVDPAGTSPIPPWAVKYLEDLRAETEQCYNAGDLDCVWQNYYKLSVGAGWLGLSHASLHLSNFLWKSGDINYRPWGGQLDSRWVFEDETAKQTLKHVRNEMWRLIHKGAKNGKMNDHIQTERIPVPYPFDNVDLYYAMGEFYLSGEADYVVTGCYTVLVRPVYHFEDKYDWHPGLPASGGIG